MAADDNRRMETALAPRPALPLAVEGAAALGHWGVITAEGPDAAHFLHGQLTQDIDHLDAAHARPAGFCSPKGRLLASFVVWRPSPETVHLACSAEVLPAVLKRLSMFVLRAKVKLADASEAWSTSGLLGAGVPARAVGVQLPTAPWTGAASGDARIDRVPGSAEAPDRWLLTTPVGAALPAWCAELDVLPSSAWWWTEVEAGVPTVFAATQEKFVPQMINFEVLGGVNFRKGCYPGQEVVARSQYLGKLKRRMQRAHTDASGVAIAADVYRAGEEQPIGTVVLAAPSPRGGTDLLFEAPIDRLESGTLHVGSAGNSPLELRGLPYELFDPTA